MRSRKGPARSAPVVAVLALAAMAASPAPDSSALHLDWLDLTASPSDDFYHFANGGWQAKNPIPPEYGRWSTFDQLRVRTQEVVRGILEAAAADTSAESGSVAQKIGDFYASGMDEAAIEAAGVSPLSDELSRVAAIAGKDDLQHEIAHLQMIGVDAAFSFGSMTDFEDPTHAIGVAEQGGIGLPDRSYYVDPDLASVRTEYAAHVSRTLQLLGDPADVANSESTAIVALETAFARDSMSRAAMRDPRSVYHVMDVATLDQLTPDFKWETFFQDVGRPDITRINLATPVFFSTMDVAIGTTPIDTWKAYLRWQLARTYSPYLSKAFQDESFHMKSVLTGVTAERPRWQRVQDAEDAVLGFAVGQKYVEAAFPPSSKASALALLHGIRAALASDLATLSWMGPATREAALQKLDQMGERIGYPDKWRDYSGLQIDRGPWALNVLRGNAFEAAREVNKIDQPIDPTEWSMTPQTVNAYYDPSRNNINFPAAILQPPFFDAGAPDSVNHGAIGFVMGHEMTHGFDDEGAQFDGKGALADWWTAEDYAGFHARTLCIADQFSQFTVEGVHLDGNLVVGEATADLGGIVLAYRAFHAAIAGGSSAPDMAGYSPDQQFFIAAAHIWAANVRPEEARLRAATDPHPPPQFRVNGTFQNVPELAAAFGIPAGSPMAPSQRCSIW